ncbi:MAG: hypothetical protein ACPG5P_05510 [Saprospiraceae bacterium]
MKIHIFLILGFIGLLMASCQEKKALEFKEINFEFNGYDWDMPSYKFSQFIKDSIMENKGKQFAGWEYSHIGDIENMLKTWDKDMSGKREPLSNEIIEDFKKFVPKNAKEIILGKAKETNVTIINEAHQMPQHRVFTTILLQDLYDQGYRHLGMEAYARGPKETKDAHEVGYPTLKNGFYTKEPQFGNMIREALRIGFRIFGYEESYADGAKGREIGQAKNIKAYMEENPEGKYLIHCGFAHATEGIYGRSWEKAMAARLTEFTGINPLTVDQVKYSEKSRKDLENSHYQTTDVQEPTVFIQGDSIFGDFEEGMWMDISVFHPRTQNFNRPQWLIYGNRQEVEIDLSNIDLEKAHLVLAYKKGEKIGSAIPYDIQETQGENVNLILGKGTYSIVLWNGTEKALQTEIDIK